MSLILGIETSCDETAAAVVEGGRVVRSSVVWSQHELHERYAGVVPEIASRAHLERILPVVDAALKEAGVALPDIDAIAVGNRPGLIGSLLVGVSAAQALAWATGKPLIGIDHVQAHLHAALLEEVRGAKGEVRSSDTERASETSHFEPRTSTFPLLGLVVSGGHTSLYLVHSPLEQTVLGRTIDDAVGEAYDKAAVILGLGYPGGPTLDRLARTGDPKATRFPRSMLGADSLDFSFSGLKTAMLYAVRGFPVGRGDSATFTRTADDLSERERADLAASFQAAAVDTLIMKMGRALDQLAARGVACRGVVIGGGVSANSHLRERAVAFTEERGLQLHLPELAYCVDNAAMIAGLAHEHLAAGRVDSLDLPAVATTSM